MLEQGASGTISELGLMRNIYSKFDENTLVIGSSATESSVGMPSEMIEFKERLFAGIVDSPVFTTSISSSDWLQQHNAQLLAENYFLKMSILAIEKRLANIESYIPEERVIVLREISREEAKEEIRNLFSTGRTLYYSDIAQELQLDLEIVVDICNELQNSREIGLDANIS